MEKAITLIFVCLNFLANAQLSPVITSWIRNTTNLVGYNSIPANVQTVQYNTTDVYVSCTGVPSYTIGPWANNPNIPTNGNWIYKFTRSPTRNTGALTIVGLGHVGVFSNGVAVYNSKDAMSYNNGGNWNQDAYINEGISFDACKGHPGPSGEYHHHINPSCLYNQNNTTNHSPIIGYAFDGFPIYGAYAYKNSDGTGGITRMKSGFVKRNITTRTTQVDTLGNVTTVATGPTIATKALGTYVEDYEYRKNLDNLGNDYLDSHNGRFCITPDYPNGTYAYFITIASDGTIPEYPYTLGITYWGTVPTGNTGPTGGKNTVPSGTTTYNATTIALEITSFTAEAFVIEHKVKLEWITHNETTTNYFLVERSLDGENFTPLSKIQGLGSKGITRTYSFIDENAVSGVNYYRVKQIDLDGSFYSSRVQTVLVKEKGGVAVFPNPTRSEVFIKFQDVSIEADVDILDLTGKIVKIINHTDGWNGTYRADLSALPRGIYFLKIHQDDKVFRTAKVVLQD